MSSTMMRPLLVALLAAILCGACGDDAPTAPSTTAPTRYTEMIAGTLAVGGAQFYSFTVGTSGATDVTLLSLRPAGVPTTTLGTTIGVGLGTPAGTDCALKNAITTAPALVKQISVTTEPSIYCVKIADVGGLSGTVDYNVRVIHP